MLHMNPLFFQRPLQNIEYAFTRIECDGHRLQNPAIFRNQFPFFWVAQRHVIQNCGAGDRERTGPLFIANFYVLRLYGRGLSLRDGVGEILVLTRAGIDHHAVDLFIHAGRASAHFLRGHKLRTVNVHFFSFVRRLFVGGRRRVLCGGFCTLRSSCII